MRFPINARTVMLLMPILLLTALEYLLKIPSVAGNHFLASLIRVIINYGLPLLFAVLAVLTVPNSEQKYRPIATVASGRYFCSELGTVSTARTAKRSGSP